MYQNNIVMETNELMIVILQQEVGSIELTLSTTIQDQSTLHPLKLCWALKTDLKFFIPSLCLKS